MPWMMVPKPHRKPGPLGRLRSYRGRVTAWSGGGLALFVLLAFWFVVARQLA
jgi:hypothetical protein